MIYKKPEYISDIGRRGNSFICKYRCFCGVIFEAKRYKVNANIKKSCGCYKKKFSSRRKHGLSHLPEYEIWLLMKSRCNNKKDKAYPDYGGRGIKVCARWNSIHNFIQDMGLRKDTLLTLDRIDNNGNYEPENCRWASRRVQNSNKRNIKLVEINGETRTGKEWCRIYKIHLNTYAYRTKIMGMSPEEALNRKS